MFIYKLYYKMLIPDGVTTSYLEDRKKTNYLKDQIVKAIGESDYIKIHNFLKSNIEYVEQLLADEIESKGVLNIYSKDLTTFKTKINQHFSDDTAFQILEYILKTKVSISDQVIVQGGNGQILKFQILGKIYYKIFDGTNKLMSSESFEKYTKENNLKLLDMDEALSQLKLLYSQILMKTQLESKIGEHLYTILSGRNYPLKSLLDSQGKVDFHKLISDIENKYFFANSGISKVQLKLITELIFDFLYFYLVSDDGLDINNLYGINNDDLSLLGYMNDSQQDCEFLFVKHETELVLDIASIINTYGNIVYSDLVRELSQIIAIKRINTFSSVSLSNYIMKRLFFSYNNYETSQKVCLSGGKTAYSIQINDLKYYLLVNGEENIVLSNEGFLDYTRMNRIYFSNNGKEISKHFEMNILRLDSIGFDLDTVKFNILDFYDGELEISKDKLSKMTFKQISKFLQKLDYIEHDMKIYLDKCFNYFDTILNHKSQEFEIEKLRSNVKIAMIDNIESMQRISIKDLSENIKNSLNLQIPYEIEILNQTINNLLGNQELIFTSNCDEEFYLGKSIIENKTFYIITFTQEEIIMDENCFIDFYKENNLFLMNTISEYTFYLKNYVQTSLNMGLNWGYFLLTLIKSGVLPQEMILPSLSQQQFIDNAWSIFPIKNFNKMIDDMAVFNAQINTYTQCKKILSVLDYVESLSNNFKIN